jgi:two-component system response regulator AtoC
MSRCPKRVLVLDAHAGRGRVRAALVGSGFDVVVAASQEEVGEILRGRYEPDLLIVGEGEGVSPAAAAIEAARDVRPGLPIILLAESTAPVPTGLLAVGVVDRERLDVELDRAIVTVMAEAERHDDGFVVGSDAMRTVRDLIRRVADTDVPVLITGQSGVGKEVVAQALHRDSQRAAMPFVKVNCAALPDQLLESELFGYEKGAFTGAERDKPGKFEIADGGTIFLDEIGEIPEGTQAKLLQVLQDGRYYRLGGSGEVRVDARVVASTNVDLEQAIGNGTFRKDLFYRLNVVRVQVPPLADRRAEIDLLVETFRTRYEREYGRSIGPLDSAAMAALQRHDWPGNVRELENVVRRMVVLEDVDSVVAEIGSAPGLARPDQVADAFAAAGEIPPLKDVARLAAMEAEGVVIRRALEQTQWNRRRAAELLQISYKALLYKMRDCGIKAA